MSALKYWDGAAWVAISNVPGPVGPLGPQGQPGIDGIDGDDGQATIIVGQFLTRTPANLPVNGLIPAGWDGAGTFPGGHQMVVGESLINNNPADPTFGDLWQFVGAGDPTGWVNVGLVRGPTGATGAPGADGATGPSGPPGATPTGGTTDQALVKTSDLDGAVGWAGPHLLLTGGSVSGDLVVGGSFHLSNHDNTMQLDGNNDVFIMPGTGTTVQTNHLVLRAGFGGTATSLTSGEQIRFGYNNQAGGTYRHEIRTQHHGSDIPANALEIWLHGSNVAPYSQSSGDAPNNRVMRLAGSQVNIDKPTIHPAGGMYVGDLWHGWRWDGTYNGEQLMSYQGKFGFYQTPGNVPGTLMYQLDTAALWCLGGRSLNNRTNSTTSGQTFNVHLIQDSAGTALAESKVLQYRGSGSWETELQFITSTNNGLNFWYKSWGGNAGSAQFYIYGQCSVGSLANRSDIALKRNVVDLASDKVKEMFAKLRPVRYGRKGPTEDSNGNPTTVPDTPEIGLIAQDVQAADPDLVTKDGDGILAYDVGGVLALSIAEIGRLGAVVDSLLAKIKGLESQIGAKP